MYEWGPAHSEPNSFPLLSFAFAVDLTRGMHLARGCVVISDHLTLLL